MYHSLVVTCSVLILNPYRVHQLPLGEAHDRNAGTTKPIGARKDDMKTAQIVGTLEVMYHHVPIAVHKLAVRLVSWLFMVFQCLSHFLVQPSVGKVRFNYNLEIKST